MTDREPITSEKGKRGYLENWLDIIRNKNRRPDPIPVRRQKLPAGQCVYCDSEREAGNDFHPPHDASYRCNSGKHSHCSCDVCF